MSEQSHDMGSGWEDSDAKRQRLETEYRELFGRIREQLHALATEYASINAINRKIDLIYTELTQAQEIQPDLQIQLQHALEELSLTVNKLNQEQQGARRQDVIDTLLEKQSEQRMLVSSIKESIRQNIDQERHKRQMLTREIQSLQSEGGARKQELRGNESVLLDLTNKMETINKQLEELG